MMHLTMKYQAGSCHSSAPQAPIDILVDSGIFLRRVLVAHCYAMCVCSGLNSIWLDMTWFWLCIDVPGVHWRWHVFWFGIDVHHTLTRTGCILVRM